jgi:hypothetical protein
MTSRQTKPVDVLLPGLPQTTSSKVDSFGGQKIVYVGWREKVANADRQFYRLLMWNLINLPAKVVSQSQDVVFAEISSSLHLYEDKQFLAWILNPMSIANCDVDGLPRTQDDIALVKCDFGFTLHNEPMFGTLGMFLVAEAFPGKNFDSFDLKTIAFI